MSKLSIGIVGLPNVGKSTLFNILTDNRVDAQNYPFCTIDPNVGIVAVPDKRLDRIAALSESAKKTPAVVEFYDIAGLVRGANKGEGLGNQFLAHIREVSAIVMVLRVFRNESVIHVEGSIDPMRDMETIDTELVLKDLETMEKACKSVENEAKSGDKEAKRVYESLTMVLSALEREEDVRSEAYASVMEVVRARGIRLLTAKKRLYLLNGSAEDVSDTLREKIEKAGSEYIVVDLSTANAVDELIEKAYRTLGLISFFTTGENETRAWTIAEGATAPQAAGAIHSDFEKKFIRAEVIAWEKLLEAGSWAEARKKGWIRLEGKEYIVKDGDVMHVRHG